MCRFKSGIIFKNRCEIAQGDNDSHTDLLESLGIKDTRENAMRVFVRAELVPPNDEWWTDPKDWEFCVDQDIVPDWFEEDKKKYEEEFRQVVALWCKEHVLVDKEIDKLSDGFYRLNRCKVKELCNSVRVLLSDSTVTKMLDNSTVTEMWGNSTVTEMLGNSTVTKMWDNSTVTEMLGNSTVTKMLDNSTVTEMWDNSTVTEMWDNSTVTEMWGNSTVTEMLGNSTVTKMLDNSTVTEMWGNSTVTKMWDNSTVTKMLDNSIARCNYKNKIMIASNWEVERR